MYVDGRVTARLLEELNSLVAARVAPRVEALRTAQDPATGAIVDPAIADLHLGPLVRAVEDTYLSMGRPDAAQAFRADVARWRFEGLDTTPRFDRTIAAMAVPANLEIFFFVAPFDTAGTHAGLEYLLAIRQEPEEIRDIILRLPEPRAERLELHVVAASDGFGRDDVRIEAAVASTRRAGVVFGFPNAQAGVLANSVIPAASEASGRTDWKCTELSSLDLYRAVCVRAYLGDISAADRWYPSDDAWESDPCGSLLDGLRVDAATAVLAMERTVPFAEAIVEMICFERLFPRLADERLLVSRRFLFAWLTRHGEGALRFRSGYLDFDRDGAVSALRELQRVMAALDALEPHERRVEARLLVARYSGDGGVRTGPTVGSGAGF